MTTDNRNDLGRIIKRRRISLSLTLRKLATESGVSASHLGRIERGERFPSAHILRKIAKPLGFDENELFTLAGFLSHRSSTIDESRPARSSRRLDPHVANMLAQESVEAQHSVIGILSILRSIAKSVKEE